MVNLTEVMSGGGTIDVVVYIYSDGVCEFDINKYDSTPNNVEVTDQSDDEYKLMIDNYADTIRKFGEMKEGDIVVDSDMISLSSSFQNGGVKAGETEPDETAAALPIQTVDNGEAKELTPPDAVDAEDAEVPPDAVDAEVPPDAAGAQQHKKTYDQVKTYLETIPNTYTMYDLLTCKWISILNNEISPIAVDKIGDLNDTIYNPVLNAFYKKNAKTTSLNHNVIKKNETQDNIRFSHFEEFWECNNTSKKWIYGRWINGTEYKFKYDNGWLIA